MEEEKLNAHEMEVKQKMERLGIYKPEFNAAIKRYVEMKKEYKKIYAKYKKSGYECEVQTNQGTKKAPIVSTLESLRRDIRAVEESLGLTPSGLLKLDGNAFAKQRENKAGGLI